MFVALLKKRIHKFDQNLLRAGFLVIFIVVLEKNNHREYWEREVAKNGVHACAIRIFFSFWLHNRARWFTKYIDVVAR